MVAVISVIAVLLLMLITIHLHRNLTGTLQGMLNISKKHFSISQFSQNFSKYYPHSVRSFSTNSSTVEEPDMMIRAPSGCNENCRELLSNMERRKLKECENSVRSHEHIHGAINANDCKFLPPLGRHPIALVSARGSGNTWTRGLLEKATGICTGFIFCDSVMRAHGYVGENVKSGKVLVVKTHSPVPKWKGGTNLHSNPADASYGSAILILRNPVYSSIAEWNRKSAEMILGKHNSTIHKERHTFVVPENLFSKSYYLFQDSHMLHGVSLCACIQK